MARLQPLLSCKLTPLRYKPTLSTSTRQERRPRKGHKKSKQGCYECKRRKIKCQETRPTCENCIRLSLCCRYLPEASLTTPLQQPLSSLQIANVFSFTDMRLFHHFLVAAFPHFPIRSDNIWLSYVTPISHQCDYLMHSLLALSASHLEKLSPSSLTLPAQTHRLAAIKGLNTALSSPLTSAEAGDTVIATCYALFMQSWYMDDGLQASLVLTRSCDSVMRWVRGQVKSVFCEGEGRVESMRARVGGAPRFKGSFVKDGLESVAALEEYCEGGFQREFWEALRSAYEALNGSPFEAYTAYVYLDTLITNLEHTSLIQLLNPSIETNQLLLAHYVALQLLMRPISCRERKQYTVTMYGIRMNTWIPGIWNGVSEEMRGYLEWPMWVAGLHVKGELERWSLKRV